MGPRQMRVTEREKKRRRIAEEVRVGRATPLFCDDAELILPSFTCLMGFGEPVGDFECWA